MAPRDPHFYHRLQKHVVDGHSTKALETIVRPYLHLQSKLKEHVTLQLHGSPCSFELSMIQVRSHRVDQRAGPNR